MMSILAAHDSVNLSAQCVGGDGGGGVQREYIYGAVIHRTAPMYLTLHIQEVQISLDHLCP